jgi:hypothetical protein
MCILKLFSEGRARKYIDANGVEVILQLAIEMLGWEIFHLAYMKINLVCIY